MKRLAFSQYLILIYSYVFLLLSGTMDCWKKILKDEGAKAFFKVSVYKLTSTVRRRGGGGFFKVSVFKLTLTRERGGHSLKCKKFNTLNFCQCH